jgi:hypothetical protein
LQNSSGRNTVQTQPEIRGEVTQMSDDSETEVLEILAEEIANSEPESPSQDCGDS